MPTSDPSQLVGSLFAALALAACSPAEPSEPGDPRAADGGGEVELELGFYDPDSSYRVLEEGSSAPVVHGLQGGTWMMPTLRLLGFSTPVRIEGALVTVGGEVLGEIDSQQSLPSQAEGWAEIRRLPIPVVHQDGSEDIGDLYGQRAALSLRVSDRQDRTGELEVSIELSNGDLDLAP